MEWLFLIIPILSAGYAKKKFDRQLVWWEICLPFVACIFAILIGKACADHFTTSDTEYLGGYLINTGYYEHWNQKVSCKHPRYCTRTVSDGKGRSHTESYQCGYHHAYDVEDHPEYWEVVDSNGKVWGVDKSDHDRICTEWNNRFFVNMNRPYHTINGNKYQSDWQNAANVKQYETLHPTVVEHSYENRIAASNSVLNYREVPDGEQKQYQLFTYPRSSFFCTCVLGYNHAGNADLDKTNALIGRTKQVRIWLLCFKKQPLEAAYSQEALWKRGNKNELVICTSLDDNNKIQWGYVFSWTEREDLKITVRQWLEDHAGQVLDVKSFNDFVKPEVEKSWERRAFADFKFIEVQPPAWAYVMICLFVILTTGGTLWWGINNDERN